MDTPTPDRPRALRFLAVVPFAALLFVTGAYGGWDGETRSHRLAGGVRH